MDFNHSEYRQMLVDMLGRYLNQRYSMGVRHGIAQSDAGWSAEHWAALAELGVVGALFGEAVGGFGGAGFDIGAVFEQLGKALVVEPFLGTLMAGTALAQAGGHAELLNEMIAGQAVVVFAHEEPQSRYDLRDVETRVLETADGWALTGSKAVVPQIEAADWILVSAREAGGISLFLLGKMVAGVSIRGYPMIDGGRGGELILEGADAKRVGSPGEAYAIVEAAYAAGNVALVWEAVGIMDVLKAATLDYLRTRKQFGVPIGKFQALQHRMATMALEIEQARSAALNAAAALGAGRLERERKAAAAKFTIGKVGTLVAEEAIQMHGGIGMTWELPLSHYAKRLTMIGHQLGDEDHCLARFIALGLGPEGATA
ncbi:acyl-CoA dehydrogenase family protein [Acidocella sp.]|uniref:acyl-CoA dehydrogenase family protein n=1 Tax=Acidocella sp. TaxID=50710 RepID=UPI002619F522|nr:acyl-CoA dehydrogenase [Acidocella sp.]MDD2796227.1 acyl-CoA dehydrogenase [Acidocella sp.]